MGQIGLIRGNHCSYRRIMEQSLTFLAEKIFDSACSDSLADTRSNKCARFAEIFLSLINFALNTEISIKLRR